VPTWESPPDVLFDHAAAERLVAAARAAQEDLDHLRGVSSRTFDRAAVTWRGRARRSAEEQLGRWWSALVGASDDLSALAAELATASEAAHVEQARRRAAQLRWQAEAAAERAARADGGGR